MQLELLSEDVMFEAALKKDASFEGLFFMGVKTTGIFCRPSCTARKPKRENVEFFKTTKDAIKSGYRPCKVCNPMQNPNATPDYINQIIKELADDPSLKFKDYDLVKRGIEPNTMRRWFLKNHGITFQAYQRMFRINSAFKKIQSGQSVTEAAFDSGFDSLSGFGESFKNIFGVSPKQSKEQTVIDLKRIDTPLGPMIVCATKEGVCLLEFTNRKMLETELKDLAKRLNAVIVQGDNPHNEKAAIQLSEYFDGNRKKFDLPLFTPGTAFQNKVWKELQGIPYGATRSYKEQAIAVGNADSVRAVATANGMNRIAIIIPCHRVIGSDGNLTGYAGGLWRKKFLLDLEKENL
ncbi:MAG: XRE family transcriptional regulator [Sphingobacteriales bacterium 41-5]|nr:MAG: XRE family transcriptional regulator [Niabella sp. SCN 42-15]OJU26033.1 MAG: XRE family transcriptional regulator [Sphingobacteriales bacterium 41-5]